MDFFIKVWFFIVWPKQTTKFSNRAAPLRNMLVFLPDTAVWSVSIIIFAHPSSSTKKRKCVNYQERWTPGSWSKLLVIVITYLKVRICQLRHPFSINQYVSKWKLYYRKLFKGFQHILRSFHKDLMWIEETCIYITLHVEPIDCVKVEVVKYNRCRVKHVLFINQSFLI